MRLIIVLFLSFNFLFATVYYVDQNHSNASDSNTGTSESLPWLTLKKATDTAVAGDTVYVKAGTYIDVAASATHPYPAFNPANDGTYGNPIVFISDSPHQAIIRAKEFPGGYMAWGLENADYIVIDGFYIVGGFRANSCTHITIKNVELIGGFYPPTDTSLNWGLSLEQTDSSYVYNCYVHDMKDSGNQSHNSGCFVIFGDCDYNEVYYNTADCDTNGTTAVWGGFQTKGGYMDHNKWHHNFSKNGITGFFLIGSTDELHFCDDNEIYNNIVINVDNAFCMLDHSARRNKIYNNTLYNAETFIRAVDTNITNVEQWNNIGQNVTDFLQWDSYDSTLTPEALFGYSDYSDAYTYTNWYQRLKTPTLNWSLATWVDSTSFDANSITTNPGFINAGGDSVGSYKRTTYTSNGRGGSYESVMGAYIDGTEQIGVDFSATQTNSGTRYISTTGTDSGVGDISSPWATLKYAFENASTGDTLYLRAGTHTVSDGNYSGYKYGIWTKYNNVDNLTIMPYNNETVTIQGETADSLTTLFVMEQDNIHFKGLTFNFGYRGIRFGYDLNSTGGSVDSCTFIMTDGGDNAGGVYITRQGGTVSVTHSTFIGPCTDLVCADVHQNTSGVIIFRSDSVTINYNNIQKFPIGIYFKHGNSGGDSLTANEISYNFIDSTSRYSIETNSEYSNWHDNLIGNNNASWRINESNGVPDGDYNTINHNTIKSGGLYLSTDDDGANYNTIKNNIISSYTNCCAGNAWSYNCYVSGDSIGSNDLANTTPTYIGGSNPVTIAGFELATGSAGVDAADDGKDMGADITAIVNGTPTDEGSPGSGNNKHVLKIWGFEE